MKTFLVWTHAIERENYKEVPGGPEGLWRGKAGLVVYRDDWCSLDNWRHGSWTSGDNGPHSCA